MSKFLIAFGSVLIGVGVGRILPIGFVSPYVWIGAGFVVSIAASVWR